MTMHRRLLAAAAIATTAAGAADAAMITKMYVTTATFTGAPIASVTLAYTLAFDPTAAFTTGAIFDYRAIPTTESFVAPVGVVFKNGNEADIGKSPSGFDGVSAGTNDFVLAFNYDSAGNPVPDATIVYFTTASSNDTYFATRAQTTLAVPPPPVPEPATWAMLVGGFGLAGAAMRRRRAAVRFA